MVSIRPCGYSRVSCSRVARTLPPGTFLPQRGAVMTVRAVVDAPKLLRPDEAQALIEAHLRSDLAGRCVACGQAAPCHFRNVAHAAFFAAGLLPRRRPGLDRCPVADRFDAFGSADR